MEIDEMIGVEVETSIETNLDNVVQKVNGTEPEVLHASFDWVQEETLVLIVKVQNEKFDYCNFDLCGKKMIDWVKLATSM